MAEPNSYTSTGRASQPTIEVLRRPDMGLLKVQLRQKDCEDQLARELRVELPPRGRLAEGPIFQCAWLAPGEWLILGPEEQIIRLSHQFDELLAGQLGMATNITHGRAVFLLTGAGAANRIASGCPLDLRSRTFAPGRCESSLFGVARVFLARLPDRGLLSVYLLIVDQTMAAYILELLEEPVRQ